MSFQRELFTHMIYCIPVGLFTTYERNESCGFSLHTNLVEHLNAEIVLHTISDVNMALDWIRSTFLYIRALKNPKHYGKALTFGDFKVTNWFLFYITFHILS